MNEVQTFPSAPSHARLRSGTAARLAGVPVATLRVWERRHQVVAAPKTDTGQRLYSMHDVQRLRLLRQLSERGHGIGTIAGLALDQLLALAAEAAPHPAAAPRRLVVIGRTAAQRIASLSSAAPAVVHEDLNAAESLTVPGERADLLLVCLPSLQPDTGARILALADRLQAGSTVVLYAFGAAPALEPLLAAGATVRRDPVSSRELARLIAAPLLAQPPSPTSPAAARLNISPRRFNDESLTRLADLPSTVTCECPRHVAELVMQLAHFERYSADCLSRTPADADLHRHLSELAGAARTLFEDALDRVMIEDGIVLEAVAGPPSSRQ
jgi:DNA-binding transcriptional MerR regulator